jgi:hypothetical protein
MTKGDLAGKTVVVFETLYVEDKEVGAHTDINDKEQSCNKITFRMNFFAVFGQEWLASCFIHQDTFDSVL